MEQLYGPIMKAVSPFGMDVGVTAFDEEVRVPFRSVALLTEMLEDFRVVVLDAMRVEETELDDLIDVGVACVRTSASPGMSRETASIGEATA